MYYVFDGFLLALCSTILRAILYNKKNFEMDRKYYSLLLLSLIGSVLGYIGFFQLAQSPIDASGLDYSQILTVLSLLAAAIVTGFFAFTFTEAADDEIQITTAILICFVVLFYLVFAAISFYSGKSANIHNAPYAMSIIPTIMWVLLVANALFDFWDYRDG
jgi:hypothetical protein